MTSTFPLGTLCGSKEAERNEPSSWNSKGTGGHLKRKSKSTKQRKGNGSRRGAFGRLRGRPLKKKRRRGCSNKRSLPHGSDVKARCSRLALR